jgi:hypothetical protein
MVLRKQLNDSIAQEAWEGSESSLGNRSLRWCVEELGERKMTLGGQVTSQWGESRSCSQTHLVFQLEEKEELGSCLGIEWGRRGKYVQVAVAEQQEEERMGTDEECKPAEDIDLKKRKNRQESRRSNHWQEGKRNSSLWYCLAEILRPQEEVGPLQSQHWDSSLARRLIVGEANTAESDDYRTCHREIGLENFWRQENHLPQLRIDKSQDDHTWLHNEVVCFHIDQDD